MPSCNLNIHIEAEARERIEQIRDAYMAIRPGGGRPGIAAIVNFALLLVPMEKLPEILNPQEPTNGTDHPAAVDGDAQANKTKRGRKNKRGNRPAPPRE
jgi:hypothetical protein